MNQPPANQAPAWQPSPPSAQPAAGSLSGRRRRWPVRAGIAAALVIALLAGVVIGSVSSSNQSALDLAHRNLRTADQQLAAARSQVSDLRAQYSAAQAQAQQATTTANAKAQAAYAARKAALDKRARSLRRRAQEISAAEGQLKSSTISSDGVYVVGTDIQPGTYHTNGDGGQTDDECYYATLNSSSTNDIADNNNFDGPETVDVTGAYALAISGPCTWVKVG